MNKLFPILFIVGFNLVPVYGVTFFNWQPFEAFWFFWVEMLIMAIFNAIRIAFSQGRQVYAVNTKQPLVYNIGKSIRYLFIRFGVFLFYSIFIITFIGFVANTDTNKTEVVTTLLFQNKFFNLGLLVSIFNQIYYLTFYFFRNGAFITAKPDNYTPLFDSKQLVIHVAVVLGAVGSMFLTKSTDFGNYSNIFIISLLCICKCVAELLSYRSDATKIEAA